ncbi:hypothetical protein LXL04_007359 [Taraxacum kok-saghyz]
MATQAYKYIKCKFCSKIVTGGAKRMKFHRAWTHKDVAPCPNEDTIDSGAYYSSGSIHPSSGSRGVRGPMDKFVANLQDDDEGPLDEEKMTPTKAKEQRNKVCMDIGKFFFDNGISFDPSSSASFPSMLRSVGNYGRDFKPPTMHELRTWVLDEEVKTTTTIVDDIRETWKTIGLLDSVIEEIGKEIVIQVATDNASAYKVVEGLLMKKWKCLYWTPCASYCIDLILEKLGDCQYNYALINFIYNHQWSNKVSVTYLTIQSMYDVKQPLQQMFVSNEWIDCTWAKKADGKVIKKINHG